MYIEGTLEPPADKSITHRALMLAGCAQGPSYIRQPLLSHDIFATIQCLEQLGVRIQEVNNEGLSINPPLEWSQPKGPLDCMNSGTTMRLLSGLLASRELEVTLIGDTSLSNRPMERIAKPLRLMGAQVLGHTAPLRIKGGTLRGIDYINEICSAQVKGCILFAALQAEGKTQVWEPVRSRDHTERLLKLLGIPFHQQENSIVVPGKARWDGFEYKVPGDISSATYAIVAAALLPKSRLVIKSTGINQTRTGILDVLTHAGVSWHLENEGEAFQEPVADIIVHGTSSLNPFCIEDKLIPRLIDEIPILAVLATQCEGVSEFHNLNELRVKESNRLKAIIDGLMAMGAKIETFEDGFSVSGPTPLKGAKINSQGDHRIAMAFTVAALVAGEKTIVDGDGCIEISYPKFNEQLKKICVF